MKKFVLILIFIILCPIFLFGCSGSSDEKLNFYDIVVEFDDENKTASVFQQVTYVNNSNNLFETLYFHLYPNAFREGSKNKVVSSALIEKAYPNGESFGKIDVQTVSINNEFIDFEIGGDDENILIVPLLNELFPDETVVIDIEFILSLPNINHRFGFGDNAINFGNFYPIACVYEEGVGFMMEAYSPTGDPFYSDVSNYNVCVSYPEKFLIAGTGTEKNTVINKNIKTTTFEANMVRDFCFVLSDKFTVIEGNVDQTSIKYFYYDDVDPQKSLQVAVDSISTFNNLFGKYPYSTFCVVQTNFVHGGMEYPNLVMISDEIKNHEEYEYVIVHETAHQWWYGVVGNNEFEDAWIDESLTEYSTALFYDKNTQYGVNYSELIKNATASYKLFIEVYEKVYKELDTSMSRSLEEFKTEPEYVNCIYTKGIIMYDTLKTQIGEEKLIKSLKKYFKDYSYKNVKKEEIISVFEEVYGRKVESFFDSWIGGKVIIL